MDDLISRQAAIDALDFEIVHMTAYCDGKNEGNPLAQYNKGLEDGKKAIEALPPVQPEPQWIPVEKELPEPRIDVWVNSDLGQMVGYYEEMVNLWYGRDYLELIVNAWMPLPEAYKPNNE